MVKEEIENIKERNQKVEADKAWETSIFRRAVITVMTYCIALWWMLEIHETLPYYKALIPTGGYVLSTLMLSPLKKYWMKNVYKHPN